MDAQVFRHQFHQADVVHVTCFFFSGVDREAAKVLFFTQSSSEKVQRACWELVYLFLSHAVFQIRPCCSFSASVPC